MNGWAIFRGSGATPKTATGTVALPSNVPAVRPMAVWGGRTTEAERKLVLTLALILAFSPWEKEPPWHVFLFSVDGPANPVAGFAKTRGTGKPSPWGAATAAMAGEGERETNFLAERELHWRAWQAR